MSERKLRFEKIGLGDTNSFPRNTHIIFRNWDSPFCCASQAQSQTANANYGDGCFRGACSSVKPLQEFLVHGMGVVPSWDSSTLTSSSRMPFAPATVNFTFNPCNIDLGLVDFVSDPTSTSSTADSEKWKPAWQTAATAGSIYLSTIYV